MHKYITVAYDLFAPDAEGRPELLEQAPVEHPFQFLSELGMALEAFEQHIAPLNEGDSFDFTLTPEEGYGPHLEDHVITVPKSVFTVNGKFLSDKVFEGNIIPLVNEEGYHFYALVMEVTDDNVTLDCNNLYAGKTLHYVGKVITSRPATEQEVTEAIQGFSAEGGGCHCGGGCGGCGGGCGEGGCGGCGSCGE